MTTVELACDADTDDVALCGMVTAGAGPCIEPVHRWGWCVDEAGRTWPSRDLEDDHE